MLAGIMAAQASDGMPSVVRKLVPDADVLIKLAQHPANIDAIRAINKGVDKEQRGKSDARLLTRVTANRRVFLLTLYGSFTSFASGFR
jgi:hypothetical protein